MKKALIYGATDFSELLIDKLRRSSSAPEVVAVLLDREYLGGRKSFGDLPLVVAEDMAEKFPPDEYGVYVTVAYQGMNLGRQQIFERLQAAGYRILSFIHPTARIEAESLGVGTIAMENVFIDRFCRLGKGNMFQVGAILGHHSTMGDFNFLSAAVCVTGRVQIGNNCFLGANCTIRNGISLGDRTMVGAAAYLNRDTKPGAVVLPTRCAILKGHDSHEIKI